MQVINANIRFGADVVERAIKVRDNKAASTRFNNLEIVLNLGEARRRLVDSFYRATSIERDAKQDSASRATYKLKAEECDVLLIAINRLEKELE